MKKNEMSACENFERRKVVKGIVGGITAVTAYSLLPARWDTPLIESVFLPAHAATSGNSKGFIGSWEDQDSISIITFNENNTFLQKFMIDGRVGDVFSGTYTISGNTLTASGTNGSNTYTLIDDNTLSMNGFLIFKRM